MMLCQFCLTRGYHRDYCPQGKLARIAEAAVVPDEVLQQFVAREKGQVRDLALCLDALVSEVLVARRESR